jgi:hypothetical protein
VIVVVSMALISTKYLFEDELTLLRIFLQDVCSNGAPTAQACLAKRQSYLNGINGGIRSSLSGKALIPKVKPPCLGPVAAKSDSFFREEDWLWGSAVA